MQLGLVINKASSGMYIMRVCKYYGLSVKQLDLLFNSLIMSIFTYGIELWGSVYYSKCDKLINCAYRYGYISGRASIKEIINKRDKKLWSKITFNTKNALQELLPDKTRVKSLRPRGYQYELPRLRTERFKNSFINRCLLNLV